MRKVTILLSSVLLLASGAAFAQPGDVLEYTPVGCMRGGEATVLQLDVKEGGELRAYFRHVNSTEWCSVDGTNDGKLSTVTMPKFETGDEIEYFFVLLNGKKVVAKSSEIYRAKNTNGCESPTARHLTSFTVDCGVNANSVGNATSAGAAVFGSHIEPVSPEKPTSH
jgi:hypothetical protein